jgi:hypothetical protein
MVFSGYGVDRSRALIILELPNPNQKERSGRTDHPRANARDPRVNGLATKMKLKNSGFSRAALPRGPFGLPVFVRVMEFETFL